MYDALTDLPNCTLFLDRLKHALKRRSRFSFPVACLLIDLDGFEGIGRTHGASEADHLVRLAAKRLADQLRPEDTLARIRGAEFAVILDGVPGVDAALTVAQRLKDALDKPFALGDRPVRVTASIGLALNSDEHQTAEEILRFATLAMRRAGDKHEFATTHAVFDPRQDLGAVQRQKLCEELREGIAQGHLCLHYQPLVDLNDGRIVGAEALVRWVHPIKGFIYPAEFLELATATGLIVDLGRWVLKEALQRLARWRQLYGLEDEFLLGVNVSDRQLQEPHFAKEVESSLAASGLPPSSVQFEMPEQTVIKHRKPVAQLRQLGLIAAVDDVGKGHASLEHLAQLDVDTLKIDRTFIGGLGTSLRDRAVVEAVMVFASVLGIQVVAEGVENEVQLRLLRELGCSVGQGFYFARPTVAELFESSLAEQSALAEQTSRAPA